MEPRPRAADYVLAGTAWALLGAVRVALVAVPFRRLVPLTGLHVDDSPPPTDAPATPRAERIGRAVRAAARRTPWDSKCLAQSLTCAMLLRAGGEPAQVRLGVRPATGTRDMSAHAWAASRGTILTGEAESHDHAVVATFTSGRIAPCA